MLVPPDAAPKMSNEMSSETSPNLSDALRAKGYRITPQRQLVLDAVETLRHGFDTDVAHFAIYGRCTGCTP